MVDTDTHWLTTISQLKLPQIEMVVTSRVSKPNEHTPFTPTKNYAKWEQLYPEKACKVTYCICHLKLCSPDIIAIYNNNECALLAPVDRLTKPPMSVAPDVMCNAFASFSTN